MHAAHHLASGVDGHQLVPSPGAVHVDSHQPQPTSSSSLFVLDGGSAEDAWREVCQSSPTGPVDPCPDGFVVGGELLAWSDYAKDARGPAASDLITSPTAAGDWTISHETHAHGATNADDEFVWSPDVLQSSVANGGDVTLTLAPPVHLRPSSFGAHVESQAAAFSYSSLSSPGVLSPVIPSPVTPTTDLHTQTTDSSGSSATSQCHSPSRAAPRRINIPEPPSHELLAAHHHAIRSEAHTQPHMRYFHQQQASTASHPPAHTHPSTTASLPAGAEAVSRAAKRGACINCRRLKTSCPEERPCGRCVKRGTPCEDRSEAEVEAGRLRRARILPAEVKTKRAIGGGSGSSGTSLESPSSTAPPLQATLERMKPAPPAPHLGSATYVGSSAEVDAASLLLYSRSFLSVAVQLGLRDAILDLHMRLTASSHPLSTHVEWHTHAHLLLMKMADALVQSDLELFLTDGLDEAFLRSSAWLASPLALWTKPATRPLHCPIQPNTEHLNGGARVSEVEDENVATMLIEWLPQAHVAFRRFQQVLASRLQCDHQLRAMRTNMTGVGTAVRDLTHTEQSFRVDAALAQLPRYATDLSSAHLGNVLVDSEELQTTPTPPALPMNQTAGEAAHLAATAADITDDEDLASRLGALGLARALAAPSKAEGLHDRVYSVHADWCPLGGPQAFEEILALTKVTRTAGMESVHDHTALPRARHTDGVECVCGASTPLPARIFANSVFERYFGWRRVDIERGMQAEGFRWNRRWYPPTVWPATHLHQLSQFKSTLDLVGRELLRTGTCAGLSATFEVESPSQLELMNRNGEVVSAAMRNKRIQRSDGVNSTSGLLQSWQIGPTQMPVETAAGAKQQRR